MCFGFFLVCGSHCFDAPPPVPVNLFLFKLVGVIKLIFIEGQRFYSLLTCYILRIVLRIHFKSSPNVNYLLYYVVSSLCRLECESLPWFQQQE